MKSWFAAGGIFFVALSPLSAQVAEEIPLGIEAVTGIRSSYLYQGVELAESSLEFQLEAEISLSNQSWANLGAFHLAESSGDFSETGVYLDYRYEWTKRLTTGLSFIYRDRQESLLESGLTTEVFASYELSEDWVWTQRATFDFGEDSLYLATEIEWSEVLSENLFLTATGGLSHLEGVLDRDGLNDFYSRISLTYTLSQQVAFTPFLASSIALDQESGDDHFFGGLWFEFTF